VADASGLLVQLKMAEASGLLVHVKEIQALLNDTQIIME